MNCPHSLQFDWSYSTWADEELPSFGFNTVEHSSISRSLLEITLTRPGETSAVGRVFSILNKNHQLVELESWTVQFI